MIVDGRTITTGTVIDCDICVVGSGVAGSCAALELLAAGKDVLLLEAGPKAFSRESQQEFKGEVLTPHHQPDLTKFRERRVGGTSEVWGGRCAPFDEIDFLERDGIKHSGWPIALQDLEADIACAHRRLELGQPDYSIGSTLRERDWQWLPDWTSDVVKDDRIWRFSPPTRFGKILLAEARKNFKLRLVHNAQALEFLERDSGQARQLLVSAGSNRFAIRAHRYVVAAGTLETTRLLLVSRMEQGGLGNDGGYLGRFYQTHLYGTAGWLRVARPSDTKTGFFQTRDGVYGRPALTIRPDVQKERGLLSTAFSLDNPPFADPAHRNGVLSAMFFAKLAMSRKIPAELQQEESKGGVFTVTKQHAMNVIRDVRSVAAFAPNWIGRRVLAKRKLPAAFLHSADGRYRLSYCSEQSPTFHSRISLSDIRDNSGMPQLCVDWRYNDSDVDRIVESIGVFEKAANGSPGFKFDAGSPESRYERVKSSFSVGSHHIGTTRMADSADLGVVDRLQRVFGAEDILVASASVFPTSGYANPTLMIAAMGVRAARLISSGQA